MLSAWIAEQRVLAAILRDEELALTSPDGPADDDRPGEEAGQEHR